MADKLDFLTGTKFGDEYVRVNGLNGTVFDRKATPLLAFARGGISEVGGVDCIAVSKVCSPPNGMAYYVRCCKA